MKDFNSLKDKYNIIVPDGWYGFDGLPDGWFDLVETLIKDLIALGWNREVHQAKEKFGGLRFYVGQATPEIEEAIRMAELESYDLCQNCGHANLMYTVTCPKCSGA